MKNAQEAISYAADQPEIMTSLLRNPITRRAAERIAEITEMHRRHDYNYAREWQIANDAVRCLTTRAIERLCKQYDLR